MVVEQNENTIDKNDNDSKHLFSIYITNTQGSVLMEISPQSFKIWSGLKYHTLLQPVVPTCDLFSSHS